MSTPSSSATLFLVATPIGNLSDLSPRAVETLKKSDLVACEDTRHAKVLMNHFNVQTPLVPLHDHNESEALKPLLAKLENGLTISLISDAGTPLICDPGYKLVHEARSKGFKVTPVPGCCAFVAALSASGLATDQFGFYGFLPAKAKAKAQRLTELVNEVQTLVFYESKHRILDTLTAVAEQFGERKLVLARELTKTFETFYTGSAKQLLDQLSQDLNQQKGEFVLMIEGNSNPQSAQLIEAHKTLELLAAELPPKKAAALASKLTGVDKKQLYEHLIHA